MERLVINGKVLLGNISGIERTSWELLKCWDSIINDYMNLEVEIVVPTGSKDRVDHFNNLKVVEYGDGRNLTLWQQIYLPRYIKKVHGTYVGFANNAPFLINSGYVILHDISAAINKQFYSNKTRIKFWLETKHVTNGQFRLATVSHFSAREIAGSFNIDENTMLVLGNGWEHMQKVETDDTIFDRHVKLVKKNYYFSLSSLAPNKNFEWIMDTARLNPDEVFAIGGGLKKEIYGDFKYSIPDNVVMLGRVSDEEAKSLLSNCKAFLFPTLYEGFGIPPLEAFACGAVSIVSDNEVMHEIYGDSVAYVNNRTPCKDINKILLPDWEIGKWILEKHSWQVYAGKFLKNICRNTK